MKRVMNMFDRAGIQVGHLWGFDSFEGLPADTSWQQKASPWSKQEPQGFYSAVGDTHEAWTQLEPHILRFIGYKNTTLIKGFFKDTLTDSLVDKHGMRPVFFVSIDCD